jgi:hypothetical protein
MRTSITITTPQEPDLTDDVLAILQRSGLTERRLAQHLKIEPKELVAVSFRLWRSTFSDERDRRAEPDATPQKRGRITRILRAELEAAFTDGHD